MKVSRNWLSKYVDISLLKSEDIANKLTFAGVEVESVDHLANATNLVIGEIVECVPHKDSDHLHVLKVNLGPAHGIKQIVCGAPNARVGLKVIVALDGAILPGGKISKGVIRGEESNGMCCSLLELGVDAKYLSQYQIDGIEELPNEAHVGDTEVLKYLGLDDVIFDLKLLANRSDLNAITNVAKEIGTLYEKDVQIPMVKSHKLTPDKISVKSLTDKCPMFYTRVVKNIVVKESPKWLKDLLFASGIRSINNIVDIGNCIMLLTGQPLHMYDLDLLNQKELSISDDFEGDFLALDEAHYKIEKGDIVITSGNEIMCLAGIMGAKKSAVNEASKNIVIEAAYFNGAQIRRTSNRLGLVSESSQRFVKGLNKDQSEYVISLATDLLVDIAFAKNIGEISFIDTLKHDKRVIEVSTAYINNRLGTSFTKQEIINVLRRDYIDVKDSGSETLLCYIPSSRIDIEQNADISEEVIRILGYQNVKSILPCLDLTLGSLNDHQKKRRNVRDYLRGQGLFECLTYTLTNQASKDKFNLLFSDEEYKIMNPLTDDHTFIRKAILPSLLEVAKYNLAHQNKDLGLFEVSDITSINHKELHLAVVLVGEYQYQYQLKKFPYDFYFIKGFVEGILDIIGVEKTRYKLERYIDKKEELHPGKSAVIRLGKELVAVFGELHPKAIKDFDLGKNSVAILEMNLSPLFELKSSLKKAQEISKFPVVTRDLALVLPKEVTSEEVLSEIRKSDRNLIKNVEVFDVYSGEGIDEGYKSLALSVTYGAEDRTLKEQEIVALETNILLLLERNEKAKLRK